MYNLFHPWQLCLSIAYRECRYCEGSHLHRVLHVKSHEAAIKWWLLPQRVWIGQSLQTCLQQLRLVLYDHHTVDKDDRVGEVHISVYELKERAAENIWVNVEGIKPEKSANQYKAIHYLPTSAECLYHHCLKSREDHGGIAPICVFASAAVCAYNFSALR